MRWLGLGNKTTDYFNSTLQLESPATVVAGKIAENSVIHMLRQLCQSTPVFLLFSLIFLYLAMLTPWFYPTALGKFTGKNISGIIFITIMSLLCCFGLPTLYAKIFLNESLRNFGLKWPAYSFRTVAWTLAALALLEPWICYFAKLTVFKQYYALKNIIWWQLIATNLFIFPIQYFAEELFFRGFLFIGIWRRVGWHSFWITDIIFTLSHMTKPLPEILLCIPASVIFNILTLNTKSIYPAVFVHSCLGVTLSLSVN